MNNYVITIGREHGSGGHMVARKLSELLGIPCYDKEMITLAAKDSGLSEEIIKMHEQKKNEADIKTLRSFFSFFYFRKFRLIFNSQIR